MTSNALDMLAGFARRAMPMVRDRKLRIVDAAQLGAGMRLAVVSFGERELLISISKAGVQLIADSQTSETPIEQPAELPVGNDPIDIRIHGRVIGRGKMDSMDGRTCIRLVELAGVGETIPEAELA